MAAMALIFSHDSGSLKALYLYQGGISCNLTFLSIVIQRRYLRLTNNQVAAHPDALFPFLSLIKLSEPSKRTGDLNNTLVHMICEISVINKILQGHSSGLTNRRESQSK